jgi:predicted phage terminase large subunit-like protein
MTTNHFIKPGLLKAAREDFEIFMGLGFAHLNGAVLEPGWHLSAMAHALARVHAGDCRRLVVTVPPRHLKSTMFSVLFPAWLLGRDPGVRIIVACYSQELSDALARDFRKIVTSNWFTQVFPRTAATIRRDTIAELTTTAGGYRYATAIGGTLTGRGADYLICDDLMKAQDAASAQSRDRVKRFFDETLLTRLNSKSTGRVIAVQQRLHQDDIVAHFLEKDGYEHLCLPAIALVDSTFPLTRGRVHKRRIGDALDPRRESVEVLEQLKAEMGAAVFEAQYQQNPTAPNGVYLRLERFAFHDETPSRHLFSRVLQSWDTAISDSPNSAYSAGTCWGLYKGRWHLLDVTRVRLDYSGVLGQVKAWQAQWQADTLLVEDAAMGNALVKDLMRARRDGRLQCRKIIAIRPKESKEVRLMSAVERLYSGLASLPREAPFMDELRREMLAFPNGRYDDQCDSLSQALNYIAANEKRLARNPGERPPGRKREPGSRRGNRLGPGPGDLLES